MSGWKEQVREETQRVPASARDRVWRALHEPRPVRRSPWPVLAPLGLAAALLTFVFWPSTLETRHWQTPDAAVSVREGRASWEPEKHQVTLEAGQLAVSVWGGPPLRVLAAGHVIELEAASLVLRVAGDSVVLAPTRGTVQVDGQLLESTEATRALAGEGARALAGLEPADVAQRQAEYRARRALESQHWSEAAAALAEVGSSNTLGAEAALVRKGELELRALNDPARALRTFTELRARFPEGSLAQERELSALEAEVALARWADVERRADAFLLAYPTSERALEVRRVLAAAALQQGERARACATVRELPAGVAQELEHACSIER